MADKQEGERLSQPVRTIDEIVQQISSNRPDIQSDAMRRCLVLDQQDLRNRLAAAKNRL